MTVDEAIGSFAAAGNEAPREGLQWALDHWPEAGPRLLALLQGYVGGEDRSEQTEQALFFTLHLLAEKGEAAAFAPLCRLLADAEAADLVLGDALAETLPGLLISTFDGDTAALAALAEQEAADDSARQAALLALAYLTRTGAVPEGETRDTLRRLLGTLRPQGPNMVWLGWVTAVSALGLTDLTGDAEGLIRRGFVPREVMYVSHFCQDLKRTRDDASGMAGFADAGVGPFTDTIGMLDEWAAADAEDAAEEDAEGAEAYAPQEPYHNPLRNVGRNDPCPCGSGRKFKKCCMAA